MCCVCGLLHMKFEDTIGTEKDWQITVKQNSNATANCLLITVCLVSANANCGRHMPVEYIGQ